MSDRKQTNKYYPPDYDPRKGSLNTQLGQHPLRKRANRLSEGILVVRYEQPYNAWCESCGCHIGKGVRFNADKEHVGDYYSTKIWQFSMTCHQCKGKIVVRTDPKNHQYVMFSGIRGKDESFSADDNNTIELLDSDEKKRMEHDALFKLEHGEKDKAAANVENERIHQLYSLQNRRLDDFAANQALRRKNREVKKAQQVALQAGAAKGLPFALAPAAASLTTEAKEAEMEELNGFRKRKALEDHAKEHLKRAHKKRRHAQPLIEFNANPTSGAAPSLGALPLVPIAAVPTSSSANLQTPPPPTPSSSALTQSSSLVSSSSTPESVVGEGGLLGLGAYDSDD